MDTPRTHAEREAAQRADEAELAANGPYCFHPDGVPAYFPEHCEHNPDPDACTICRCSRLVDGSCMNLWPGHPAYGTCRCACHANDAPDPQTPAAREAPRCPDCGESGAARDCEPCVLATLPPMAGGDGPGATLQEPRCAICRERPVNPDDGVLCDPCFAHYNSHGDDPCPACPPFTEHTHPCPNCRHDRSCACTVFVPGEPLECATCSNCRGW